MENTATRRPTSLRARLIAEGAVHARPGFDTALDTDDPFAGDDILWADEDWPGNWSADDGSWLMFSYGLTVAVVLSALVWLLLAGAVFFVYRIAT